MPHPDTRNLLEEGLLWERGSIMTVLRGGAPQALPHPQARPIRLAPAPHPDQRTPATSSRHGLGSDLHRLGLDPHDTDVQRILALKHLSRRAKIRWLAELADAIAEESDGAHSAPHAKDESP